MYKEKEHAFEWIEDNEQWLGDFSQEIWEYAEPAWREYRSADAYCELLRDEGFEVEEGSGDMPTAFVATYGENDPVLATYAEYDAVPANSQQAVPYQAPREGLHPYAAGHTDPHSVLGVAALGGVLATKDVMEQFDVDGTIRLFGEPAEKVCGSKPVHAAKGYFDDHDAHIAYHPHGTNTTVRRTHCGSYWSVVFQFETEDPQKWASPELIPSSDQSAGRTHATARCPGAIDAVCLMYTTTKYTKEAMFPHTGTWTMNEYIMSGGQKTSDNLTPRISQIQYCWRSPTLDIQERMYNILRSNAEQVAGATSCTVTERWVTKTRVGLSNEALADLTYRNMELVGAPEFSEEAREFVREIQRNLHIEPMEDPIPDDAQKLRLPETYEENVRMDLPDWQENFTSDDYVDYTWHAPTVRLYTGTGKYMLDRPSPEFNYPEWAGNAVSGVRALTDPGMFVASKTIAATFLDLMTQPEHLDEAQREFEERTGGGINGMNWIPPLLDEDFQPPVDLPWPEYIETERGREWWMPTPLNSNSVSER